tara:strand:+ start:10610 stop:10810 length:201 start_codon:yes stop_codon:yes gene_type:complete
MIKIKNLPKDWYLCLGIHAQKGNILDKQVAETAGKMKQILQEGKLKLPRMRYFTYQLKKVELIENG